MLHFENMIPIKFNPSGTSMALSCGKVMSLIYSVACTHYAPSSGECCTVVAEIKACVCTLWSS